MSKVRFMVISAAIVAVCASTLSPAITVHGNTQFIRFMERSNIKQTGEFILKSGKKSNVYFNFGLVNSGKLLGDFAGFYAEKLVTIPQEYDVVFGCAYKGITFVCGTALQLQRQYKIDKPFAFNRKEEKDHGDGGLIVGANLRNKRVAILDDVLTTGGSIKQAIDLIREQGGIPVCVVVALDRRFDAEGISNALGDHSRPIHNLPVHALSYTLADTTTAQ